MAIIYRESLKSYGINDFLNRIDPKISEILYKILEKREITKEEAYNLIISTERELSAIMSIANIIRDNGKGKIITYSRNVFVPLTNLCRNRCGYCSFRKELTDAKAEIMDHKKVLSIIEKGNKYRCTEALFTLGEKPETYYTEARKWLKKLGYKCILDYLRDLCEMVITKTKLLPHSNPGIMTKREMNNLKNVNASMGLMLENISDRLSKKGGPHEFSPSKRSNFRLATLENAGQLKIPFTTGLLIGIGETPKEIIDSLYALKKLNQKYGHIQEVIIQNFKAKTNTPMSNHPEPSMKEILKIVAISRIILGEKMNLQVPPNLHSNKFDEYLYAGINDWGGISPITQDQINPEAPWPKIKTLKKVTEKNYFKLKNRLPIYPEFILEKSDFIQESLKNRILSLIDTDGYTKEAF